MQNVSSLDATPGTLTKHFTWIFIQPSILGRCCCYACFQIRRLRLRNVKQLVEGHSASKCGGQDGSPGLPDFQAYVSDHCTTQPALHWLRVNDMAPEKSLSSSLKKSLVSGWGHKKVLPKEVSSTCVMKSFSGMLPLSTGFQSAPSWAETR